MQSCTYTTKKKNESSSLVSTKSSKNYTMTTIKIHKKIYQQVPKVQICKHQFQQQPEIEMALHKPSSLDSTSPTPHQLDETENLALTTSVVVVAALPYSALRPLQPVLKQVLLLAPFPSLKFTTYNQCFYF